MSATSRSVQTQGNSKMMRNSLVCCLFIHSHFTWYLICSEEITFTHTINYLTFKKKQTPVTFQWKYILKTFISQYENNEYSPIWQQPYKYNIFCSNKDHLDVYCDIFFTIEDTDNRLNHHHDYLPRTRTTSTFKDLYSSKTSEMSTLNITYDKMVNHFTATVASGTFFYFLNHA